MMRVRAPLNHRRTTDGPTDSRVLNIEAPSIAFHGDSPNEYSVPAKFVKVKVKVRALDIAPLRVPSPEKRSAMARVLKGSHSFTCTPTRSSAIGMSHTCLCLPSYSWYSFNDPEGWKAELAWWLRSETVYVPESSHPSYY